MRRCGSDVATRYAEVIGRLPFFDERSYETQFFSGDYDVYIYSMLMDMSSGLYRYGTTDFVVPFGDYKLDITDESNWDWILSQKSFFPRLSGVVSRAVPLRGNAYRSGVRSEFALALPANSQRKQLILLNGAEIAMPHRYEHETAVNIIAG